MKKIVIVIVLILVAVLIFATFEREDESVVVSPASFIQTNADITRYQINEEFTEYGLLAIYFENDSAEELLAQVAFDLNSDGEYTDDEWIIRNRETRSVAGVANRLGFTLPEQLTRTELGEVPVRFTLTSSKLDSIDESTDFLIAVAPIENVQVVEQFGINIPGASPDLKRGVGNVAYAEDFEESGSNINDTALPDLNGGPMDCFAIATANNLINMATQHGRRDDLPADPQQIISELKSTMGWRNGITNENFFNGKADYVEAYDLPITTEEIKQPTLEDLHNAFANGDALEISTTMLRSRSGKADTGHVFTGVSTYQDGAEASVAVHDSGTPEGTDVFELSMTEGDNPFILIKYPLWDGVMIVDAIFIQTWNEPEETTEDSSSGISVEEPQTDNSVGQNTTPIMNVLGIETSFAHVKPGEYSEVYAVVTGLTPGDDAEARLFGGGHTGTPQVVSADDNGVAHYTWRITQYDTYIVRVESEAGDKMEATPLVVN